MPPGTPESLQQVPVSDRVVEKPKPRTPRLRKPSLTEEEARALAKEGQEHKVYNKAVLSEEKGAREVITPQPRFDPEAIGLNAQGSLTKVRAGQEQRHCQHEQQDSQEEVQEDEGSRPSTTRSSVSNRGPQNLPGGHSPPQEATLTLASTLIL